MSLSAADAYIGQPKDDLIRTFFDAVGELFPRARDAALLDAVVTRERAATFAAVAGSRRFRPPAATAVPGPFVAGAWCDTGWPATMEGAVRSGRHAAQQAIEAIASAPAPAAVPEVPAPLAHPPIPPPRCRLRRPRGSKRPRPGYLRGGDFPPRPQRVGPGHRGAGRYRRPGRAGHRPGGRAVGIRTQRTVAHHLAGGGKRIRAALVLLAARAAGGEERDAMPGAVAIELVHNFSLLHDDLIDGDRQRRHRSTVWAEFGVGPAVVGGDALATLALQVLLAEPTPPRVRAAAILADATLAMISGRPTTWPSRPVRWCRWLRPGHGSRQDRRADRMRHGARGHPGRGTRTGDRGAPGFRPVSAPPFKRSTTCWASGGTRR